VCVCVCVCVCALFDRTDDSEGDDYDVVIVGAGCIGGAVARELSKYSLRTLVSCVLSSVTRGSD
jgi:hypothetical protein